MYLGTKNALQTNFSGVCLSKDRVESIFSVLKIYLCSNCVIIVFPHICIMYISRQRGPLLMNGTVPHPRCFFYYSRNVWLILELAQSAGLILVEVQMRWGKYSNVFCCLEGLIQ